MGLIIDNVVLNLKGTEGTKEEKEVRRYINEIKNEYAGRFPLQIRFGDHLSFKKIITQGSREFTTIGYPELRTIPISCDIMLNGTRVNVRYFESERRENGNLVYLPEKKLNFKGTMSIKETELDKAFYLLCCYGNIENAKNVDGIKRIGEPKDKKTFVLIDTHKLNNAEMRYNKVRSSVENALANEMESNNVKKIAIFYGISQADNKPAEVLRNELIRHLSILAETSGDKISVYDEFNIKFEKMMTSDGGLEATVRSLISKAVEKRCIASRKIVGAGGGREWCYMKETGARLERLHKIMPDKSDVESLVIYLLDDEKAKNELEEYVKRHE